MPGGETDGPVGAPPSGEALLAIGADDWAWFLGVVRSALHGLADAHVTPEVERLRASPSSRLAGGRMRRDLVALLAAGGPVWARVRDALDDAEVPAGLAWLVTGAPGPAAPSDGPRPTPTPTSTPDRDLVRTLKERARSLREERDDARRRLDGAEARAEVLEGKLAELADELDRERERSEALEAALADAGEEQLRAVERERRRSDSRVAELEAELRGIRRRDEDERQEQARRERAREAAEQRAREEALEAERRSSRRGARVVPGRPTRLPRSIAPGTREEASALLGPGRRVLLDGYNITLNHQPNLSLEEQRTWLLRKAAALATRLEVRPTVVFDGRGGGGARPPHTGRGVAVIFSPEGVTADDEIVLAVAATDEPIVVVTDDNGLRDRVRAHGADLVRVDQFLWVAG